MGAFLRFAGIFAGAQLVSYFVAGGVARAMGVDAFYPPSPTALSYLKSMDAIGAELGTIALAQIVRGILFAIVLFPLRRAMLSLPLWLEAVTLGGIVLIFGYVAASGGMIEHFVFFSEYPAQFALITSVEVLLQSLILGFGVAWLDRALGGAVPV
jgi:hypothetical protein